MPCLFIHHRHSGRDTMLVTTLLALAAVASSAESAAIDERITGGTLATRGPNGEHPFPYLVSVAENGEHFCGGFIYNPKWVVTTASCVDGKVIAGLSIVAGQYDLIDTGDTDEEHINVFRVVKYDTYTSTNRTDDLALLELSSAINLNGNQKYNIDYNEVNIDDPSFPIATFMGWGATVFGGGVSPKLRYLDTMEIKEDVICDSFAQEEFTIARMICAADSNKVKSPCTFDEGSPLVQVLSDGTQFAVGILSQHSANCDPTMANKFTRLSPFYAWLLRTAGEPYGTTLAPPGR